MAELVGAPQARAPAPSPTAQNFLNFMQFFAKFGKSYAGAPPPGGLASPPTGNSGSAPVTPSPISMISVLDTQTALTHRLTKYHL